MKRLGSAIDKALDEGFFRFGDMLQLSSLIQPGIISGHHRFSSAGFDWEEKNEKVFRPIHQFRPNQSFPKYVGLVGKHIQLGNEKDELMNGK